MNVYAVVIMGPDGLDTLTWAADSVEQAKAEILKMNWKPGVKFKMYVSADSDETITFYANEEVQ